MITDPTYLKKATRELSKDPRMRRAIKAVGPIKITLGRNLFVKLAQSIVGQQLSGKASMTIWNRVVERVASGGKTLKAEDVLKARTTTLHACGLSRQKASYLKALAEYVVEQKPIMRKFEKLSNEKIITELTQIKGIGRWTVEMFLMFGMGRTDLLPTDDLGIKKGFMQVYNLRTMPDARKMQKLAATWSGHYTLGCLYLWRILEVRERHLA